MALVRVSGRGKWGEGDVDWAKRKNNVSFYAEVPCMPSRPVRYPGSDLRSWVGAYGTPLCLALRAAFVLYLVHFWL